MDDVVALTQAVGAEMKSGSMYIVHICTGMSVQEYPNVPHVSLHSEHTVLEGAFRPTKGPRWTGLCHYCSMLG